MKIKTMQVGQLATNCYLLEDETAGLAAVIDPGDEAEKILNALEEDGMKAEYILLTHGHYDHITAVPELCRALPGVKVYLHRADARGVGFHVVPLADQVEDLQYYGEGDVLTMGALTVRVLHTPGHTPGSVTLQAGDVLFTGDTLFAGDCGRTDFPGGSYEQMLDSLARLGRLEGDFRVLPGHMGGSTLDRERKINPYLKQGMGLK